jgi:hypothetical protein
MSPSQVPYDDAHKVSTVYDMEMFKNLEKGEVARICVLDDQAYMALRHYVKDTGYYECHGDYETVMRELSDPSKCYACKYAQDGRDVPVSMPMRHFVSHILRYTTNNKGELLKPLSFKIQAWSFSNDKFNMLTERQKNHGKLRGKDLIITCTEKNWQRYDIDIGQGPALWLQLPELKQRVADLWKSDRHLDIDKLLCRKVDAQQLKEVVARVVAKAPADVQAEALSDVGSVLSEADLDGLLSGVAPEPLVPAALKPNAESPAPSAKPKPVAEIKVATATPITPVAAVADMNFDDILNLK